MFNYFYEGQKVVCIDDSVSPGEPGPYLVEGRVYTIAGFEDCRYTGDILLMLEELPHGDIDEWYENTSWTYGYNPKCFRPLEDAIQDTEMKEYA